jgi:TolB-like protein
MTDALIAHLSGIRAVRVISRTSVLRYKGRTKTVP